MMDSCRELYSFYDNSPKRQTFLNIVIDVLEKGETIKRKVKNLCTLEAISDLYEYLVITLNEISDPTGERFACPGEESWNWDCNT